MEEIDVVFGGINIENPPINPPKPEKLKISEISMNATCFALTHNGLLGNFPTFSKMVIPTLVWASFLRRV